MKFRFCGGLEPPDWLLAEMPLLSGEHTKVTANDLVVMCEAIGEDIALQELDHAQRLFDDAADAKAAVAALRFILTHAAKYDAERRDLGEELQQLGMQQEAVEVITQSYEDQRVRIQGQQRTQSFQFAHVEKVEWEVKTPAEVNLSLKLNQPTTDCSAAPTSALSRELNFGVNKIKFLALVEELRHAQTILRGGSA